MVFLLLQNQVLENVPFDLVRDLTLVGRGKDAHIRVEHPSMSRIHARIERHAGGFTIEDLGSANGTWVNDERRAEPTPIGPGDRIRCGEIEFRVGGTLDAAVPLGGQRPRHLRTLIVAALVVAVVGLVGLIRTTWRRPLDRPAGESPALAASIGPPPATWPIAAPVESQPINDAPPPAPIESPPASPAILRETPPDTGDTSDDGNASQPAVAANPAPPAPPPAVTPAVAPTPPPAPFAARLATARAAGANAVIRLWKECESTGDKDDAARALAAALELQPDDPELRARHGEMRYRGQWQTQGALVKLGVLDDEGRLRGRDDERFAIRRLYIDLLGRTPGGAEFTAALGLTPGDLVEKLLSTVEHQTLWYENELFYFLLLDDFRPPDDRLGDLPGRVAAAQLDVKDGIGEIVKSQYFNARNPGNDTYVTVILEQLLGITVQKDPRLLEAAKKMYDGYPSFVLGRKGTSQGDFVEIVLQQPQFATFYVARQARRLLGEELPKKELQRLADRFHANPSCFRDLERELVTSPPYEQGLKRLRQKNDHQFVRSLYQDLFERAPTYQELRNVRNATQALADPIGIRSVIIKTMLESEQAPFADKASIKPEHWIPQQFLRFLSRRPTDAELNTFLDVWKTPACRPSTIIHAILTSAEYQHY